MFCQSDVNLRKSQNLMFATCSDEDHSRGVSLSLCSYMITPPLYLCFYFYLFVFIFVSITVEIIF